MNDPQQPGTLWFMFWILFGLIAYPFVACGKAVGCINSEVRVEQPDCELATQKLCDKERMHKVLYPSEYE